MPTVYQHQLHAHKPHRRHPGRWVFAACVVLAVAIYWGLHQLTPDTHITQAKAVTRQITVDNQTQTFTEGDFSIALPKGWQFMSKQQDVNTIYHFHNTAPGQTGARLLDVYEDSSLQNFAINRMLPVSATADGGLTTNVGLVSDNCTEYTTGSLAGQQTVGRLAKWQGIEFLCDMGNTLRNVVGSGSVDGLNTVTVQSPTSRPHHFFFTYTDDNIQPDYTIFAKALQSFHLTE